MSCFGVKKQHLLPSKKAKRAWKSFSSALQSKLRKLERSKAMKEATTHLNTILGRRRVQSSSYHFQRKKLCPKKLHRHRSFAPVYVDALFCTPEPACGEVKVVVEKSAMADGFGVSNEASAASSSMVFDELTEVDIRAEMFIAKFKEEMRLQRQRSLGEYQEMLARGV